MKFRILTNLISNPIGSHRSRSLSLITSGTLKTLCSKRRSSTAKGTAHRSGYDCKAVSMRCKSVVADWSSTCIRKKENCMSLRRDSSRASKRSSPSSRNSALCNLKTYFAQAQRMWRKKLSPVLFQHRVVSVFWLKFNKVSSIRILRSIRNRSSSKKDQKDFSQLTSWVHRMQDEPRLITTLQASRGLWM